MRGIVSANAPSSVEAFVQWVDKHRVVLFVVLAICYLAAFSGQMRLGPDTSLYVSLGRNLAAGNGYTSTGWPRGNAHFGLPLILAANFKAFGNHAFFPVMLLLLFSGGAALFFVYRIFRFRLTRGHAVVVSLLVGTAFTFTEYLYELLTDMPSFLGVAASIAAFEALVYAPPSAEPRSWRWRCAWLLCLVGGLGLALIMRPVTATLMLAMFGALLLRVIAGRASWKAILIPAGVIAAGFAIFYLLDPREVRGGDSHEDIVRRMIVGRLEPILRLMKERTLGLVFGPLTVQTVLTVGLGRIASVMAAAGLITAALWASRTRPLWLLWIGGTLVMLLAYPQPQTRYYLPILPFLALGYWQSVRFAAGRPWGTERARRIVPWVLLTLGIAAWLVPNMARLGKMAYMQHSRPFLAHVINGRYVAVEQMSEIINRQLPEDAVVLSIEGQVLEAFGFPRRYMQPIEGHVPPQLQSELESLLARERLYVVEADGPELQKALSQANLQLGPVLATVPRGAWELPRAEVRWLTPVDVPVPNPLVLRRAYRLPPTTTSSTETQP